MPAAHGILVPQPGIESASPTLVGGFLTTGPPRKSVKYLLNFFFFKFSYVGSSFWHMGFPHGTWNLSTPTWDRTHIPCIGRWILNHWATREVPLKYLLNLPFSFPFLLLLLTLGLYHLLLILQITATASFLLSLPLHLSLSLVSLPNRICPNHRISLSKLQL